MVAQAAARNVAAVRAGRVDVQQGSADRLRFASRTFDQAAAINSLEVRPDAAAGLRKAHCAQARGRVALGFAPFAAQSNAAVAAAIADTGFASRAQPHAPHVLAFHRAQVLQRRAGAAIAKGGWV